jgi:hypothetical protein
MRRSMTFIALLAVAFSCGAGGVFSTAEAAQEGTPVSRQGHPIVGSWVFVGTGEAANSANLNVFSAVRA